MSARERFEADYRAAWPAGTVVGLGIDKKTNDYHAEAARTAFKVWSAGQKAGREDGLREAETACINAVPRAHTYASENADLYLAGDHARDQCTKAIRALMEDRK